MKICPLGESLQIKINIGPLLLTLADLFIATAPHSWIQFSFET